MGILSSLFGGSSSADDGGPSGTSGSVLTCDSCGTEIEEDEMEEGQCEECYNSEYTGPRYCCGGIYESGEDTCRSCGEPL